MSAACVRTRMSFYGCYLLQSRHPQGKGRSYIGFTVNPQRRIRQHNGEISNGASKTKRWRPWDMVLVLHGFPTQTAALQFEWAWQHPDRSLDVRDLAAKLGRKARYGVKGKVLLLMEMLNAPPWLHYPLSVQFLSGESAALRTGASPPPAHIPVAVGPLEDLPEGHEVDDFPEEESVQETSLGSEELEDAEATEMWDDASTSEPQARVEGQHRQRRSDAACLLCSCTANRTWSQCHCGARFHVDCLAQHCLAASGAAAGSLPVSGSCPSCSAGLMWSHVLASMQHAGWAKHRGKAPQQPAKAAASVKQARSQPGSPAKAAIQSQPTCSAAATVARPLPGSKPAARRALTSPGAGASRRPAKPRKLQPLFAGEEPAGRLSTLLATGRLSDCSDTVLVEVADNLEDLGGSGAQLGERSGRPVHGAVGASGDLLELPLQQRLRQRAAQQPPPLAATESPASSKAAQRTARSEHVDVSVEIVDLVSPLMQPAASRAEPGQLSPEVISVLSDSD